MLLVLNISENRSSFRSNVFRSATPIRRGLSKSYHVSEGIAYPVPVPVPRTASICDPGNPGFDSEQATVAFAQKCGWDYTVKKHHTPLLKDRIFFHSGCRLRLMRIISSGRALPKLRKIDFSPKSCCPG
ncbi:uncharacterized protein LOC130777876 [Actinidia eriantha]|nr:uncharacterized protein LOC130777876 [Actinidia eriantha]